MAVGGGRVFAKLAGRSIGCRGAEKPAVGVRAQIRDEIAAGSEPNESLIDQCHGCIPFPRSLP